MNALPLSSYFTLNRRYSRSINLERDLVDPTSLPGYVLTERSEQTLKRIAESFAGRHPMRAWMLTGIYGTGKSAFGHFLTSLCLPPKHTIRKKADELLSHSQVSSETRQIVAAAIPERGFICAAVTAQREPISHTIVRSLMGGNKFYWHWKNGQSAEIGEKLLDLDRRLTKGKPVASNEIINVIQEIAKAGKTGLLLLIDELGKCLEFAAQNRDQGDLYVLQQIAESMGDPDTPVFLVGILHQAFSEYSYGLGTVERNEWTKIQGRFVEIPFTESALQMSQLIGQVIQCKKDSRLEEIIASEANAWHTKLTHTLGIKDIPTQVLATAFPLHPVTTLILPQLCIKYAQNDRSLFTFLTGTEPHSFRTWLDDAQFNGNELPLLKLEKLYDYFVDAAGIGMASRPNFQRWVEVKNLIDDYRRGEPDELRVLKTIGILNLASVSGTLKATRQLTVMALCDSPNDKMEQKYWDKIVERLIARGLLTHRQQVDELRIWEGSDFDIGEALTQQMEQQRESLADLLAQTHPLRPLVAQRHSYQTGALRFFECRYLDSQSDLTTLQCASEESAGIVAYWVDDKPPHLIPSQTTDHKPLVFLEIPQVETLRVRARELMALKQIQANAAELQSDGIARREVRYRMMQSQQMLDDTFAQTVEGSTSMRCFINGQTESLNLRKSLNARLSQLCDELYRDGMTLWNEIINRQELSSQGSMASRQVITRMLEQPELAKLGLEGNGPEVSVYYSVLQRTGIHREVDGGYGFHRGRRSTHLAQQAEHLHSELNLCTPSTPAVRNIFGKCDG